MSEHDIWNELGNLYYRSGAYTEALRAFQKSIECDPKDPATWDSLGEVYQKLNRNEDAIAAYQLRNVCERDRREADPWLDKFRQRFAVPGRLVQPDLEAEEIAPQTAQPEMGSKPVQGDPEMAAIPGQPASAPETIQDQPPAFVGQDAPSVLADSTQAAAIGTGPERPDPAAGREPFFEALPLSPEIGENNEPAMSFWISRKNPSGGSDSKLANRESGTALATVETPQASAIAQFADQVLIGNRLLTDGKNPASVILLKQEPLEAAGLDQTAAQAPVARVSPSNLMEGNACADGLNSNASLEGEIAVYRKVTEINPQNDRAWDALGNMYEAAGLHEEAITSLEKAISVNPAKEVYHYHLSLAYAAQMRYDKAIEILQVAVSLNPQYLLAHCALAGYYRRVGRGAEAQQHIDIARPGMENETEYNRACFEAICGNLDQAFAFLQVALEKQQIRLDWIRSDPDLDLLRNDPRFEMLLQENIAFG